MLFEGFLIGLLGSLHCIGMCGPIALLIPTSKNPALKFIQIITYNFGRVLTYSMFGLVFGLLGESFRLAKIQQYTSVVVGLVLITIVVMSFFAKGSESKLNKLTMQLFNPIKKQLGKLLGANRKNLLLVGGLNGFLPCGLIYFALAGSLTASSIQNSMLFMALFGLGTLPAMMFFMYFKSFINAKINVKRIVPYMLLVMGFLLVLRGMNLGIPYVSPKMTETENSTSLGGCCSSTEKTPTCH
jgi:sulfite exporter TauE/SafE